MSLLDAVVNLFGSTNRVGVSSGYQPGCVIRHGQDLAQGISKHSWNIHVKAQAHEAAVLRAWAHLGATSSTKQALLAKSLTLQVERLLRTPPGAFFGIPGEPGQDSTAQLPAHAAVRLPTHPVHPLGERGRRERKRGEKEGGEERRKELRRKRNRKIKKEGMKEQEQDRNKSRNKKGGRKE